MFEKFFPWLTLILLFNMQPFDKSYRYSFGIMYDIRIIDININGYGRHDLDCRTINNIHEIKRIHDIILKAYICGDKLSLEKLIRTRRKVKSKITKNMLDLAIKYFNKKLKNAVLLYMPDINEIKLKSYSDCIKYTNLTIQGTVTTTGHFINSKIVISTGCDHLDKIYMENAKNSLWLPMVKNQSYLSERQAIIIHLERE